MEPVGEEGLADADVLSIVSSDVRLLRDVYKSDTAGSTFAEIRLAPNSALTRTRSQITLFLIIDHSEHSAPLLNHIKMTACIILQGLQAGDVVSVVACGSTAKLLVDGVEKGSKALVDEERLILSLQAERGGCDLTSAVVMAAWRARAAYQEQRTNRVFLLGLGRATSEEGLLPIVHDLARDCIYTHVYAFGPAFNADLLIGLAAAGLGQFHRVGDTERVNEIVKREITDNSIAGKHVRVCVRPRQKAVAVMELYDFEAVKELDTFLIDVGDIYFGQTIGMLVKFSYHCTPGRKDLLEVHVSHYDAEDARHLRTHVAGATFLIDDADQGPPYVHIVDKIMKVHTAVALTVAHQSIIEGGGDTTQAKEIFTNHADHILRTQHLATSAAVKLGEEVKMYLQRLESTDLNLDILRCQLKTSARLLFRE